jgi:Sulfotransferase domain
VDELMAAYPDAKIILSVRDNVDVWHKSVTDTLWASQWAFGMPKTTYQAFMQLFIPKPAGIKVPQCIYKYTYLNNHPEKGREAYLRHNAHVRAVAPKDKFLEFNVKQGWGPLCEFLEVPVPKIPFPRVNDTATFLSFIEDMRKEAALQLLRSIGTMVASFAVLGAALWFARGRL